MLLKAVETEIRGRPTRFWKSENTQKESENQNWCLFFPTVGEIERLPTRLTETYIETMETPRSAWTVVTVEAVV